jgi:hypothetical protein
MSKIYTGGWAFPTITTDSPEVASYVDDPGMTLLDYFAAKAMQSIVTVSCSTVVEAAAQDGLEFERKEQAVAYVAYGFAEAMVAEKRRRESAP